MFGEINMISLERVRKISQCSGKNFGHCKSCKGTGKGSSIDLKIMCRKCGGGGIYYVGEIESQEN